MLFLFQTPVRRFHPQPTCPFATSEHQNGIALLTCPFNLTGYPSILHHIIALAGSPEIDQAKTYSFPAFVQPQPQKIEAGQQITCRRVSHRDPETCIEQVCSAQSPIIHLTYRRDDSTAEPQRRPDDLTMAGILVGAALEADWEEEEWCVAHDTERPGGLGWK